MTRPSPTTLMANDVLGLMDHLGIDKADWSAGATAASSGAELAIKHPER